MFAHIAPISQEETNISMVPFSSISQVWFWDLRLVTMGSSKQLKTLSRKENII